MSMNRFAVHVSLAIAASLVFACGSEEPEASIERPPVAVAPIVSEDVTDLILNIKGLVVHNIAVSDQTVLTMGCVRVKRNITDNPDPDSSLANRPHRAAYEVFRVECFVAVLRFPRRVSHREHSHCRNPQIRGDCDCFSE